MYKEVYNVEKFIIATSFNVQNRNRDKIGEMLNTSYGKSKDVTLINIDNMSNETLEKFIDMGGIDCFIFSAEYIGNIENKNMIKKLLTSDIKYDRNTKLINVFDSLNEESKKKSIEVGNAFVEEFESSLVHYDINTQIELLSQNLQGIKNDVIRNRKRIQLKETEIFDLTKNIVKRIDVEKDHYTADHIKSVSLIADEMAIKMGINDDERDILKVGALLHDVGKEYVSSSVLKKPSKLTDEEFNEMKAHVVFGEVELSKYNLGEYERAKAIASEHHERYDGRSYPRGIKGEQIDKLARILSIADAAQAMFGRSYQAGRTKEDLINQLNENAGTQFDPYMINTLIDILQKTPEDIGVSYDDQGKISYRVKDVDEILNKKRINKETMDEFFMNLKDGVEGTTALYEKDDKISKQINRDYMEKE